MPKRIWIYLKARFGERSTWLGIAAGITTAVVALGEQLGIVGAQLYAHVAVVTGIVAMLMPEGGSGGGATQDPSP